MSCRPIPVVHTVNMVNTDTHASSSFTFFFRLFTIWGRRIEFSISTFSGFVRLLTFTCFCIIYFLITSLRLSFGLPIFRCPPTSMFSLLYLIQTLSPHGLIISISLLLYSLALSSFLIFSIVFIPKNLNLST